MPADRLTRSEKLALFLWIAVGIGGAIFAHHYFFRAFPEASVDFRISREEAVNRARAFLTSVGEDAGDREHAIIFQVDDNAKVYLERELGLQEANRLMSSELNIWYWDVRFFKPQQEEEFHVAVNPAGEIVGYEHKIEKSRAGAKLERGAAEAIAKGFLTEKLGKKTADWDFLPEEARVETPETPERRFDWTFTWEKHGFRVKDAPDRLRIKVQGDRLGEAEESLHVPEAWQRSYGQLRSTNSFYNQVAIIPYLLFFGAAVWYGISMWRRGQTSWAGALKLGAIIAVPLFLMQLNEWPLARAGYDTNASYSTFVVGQIAAALGFALLSVLTIALVLPGGEPLYRMAQPNQLRLGSAFTLRGLRSKEFFSSSLIGLAMAAGHIGFIVAFYMVAGHYGAWAPQDLKYQDSINTVIPWIAGVAIGLLASTSEEFLFRLFAIPFLRRLTGSRVIAIIIPAFSWGFLHSAYPNEPPYIRGLEVGLIGIVAGLVMLRWGILATLIWHYTVDASLVGLLLIRSDNLYFKISGVIVGAAALAPLLLSGISYLMRGRFEPDEDLLNRSAPVPEASTFNETADNSANERYVPLSTGVLAVLAIGLVVGAGLAVRFKPDSIGSYLRLSMDARSARVRAGEVLRAKRVDVDSYRSVVVLVDTTDAQANEFLRRRMPIARINDIYAGPIPGALWRVRFFREGQAEEYSVILKPDGALHSIHHKIAEDATGASLTKEEAVARGETFLREEKKLDLQNWHIVDYNPKKLPHRVDHTLVWQQNQALNSASTPSDGSSDHAYARVELQVAGDEINSYRAYVKIPEEWARKNDEKTLGRVLLSYAIPLSFGGAFFFTALILFLKNLRTETARAIPWRRLTRWSMWGLVGYAVFFALGTQYTNLIMNSYQTEIPYKFILGGLGIGVIVGAAFYFFLFLLLFGMTWYFASEAFGAQRIPSWTGMPPGYYRDAICIALGGGAVLIGLERIIPAIAARWPTVHRATEATFGQDYDAVLPAGAVFGGTLVHGLLLTLVVALTASFVAARLRPIWLRLPLFVLGAMLLVGAEWGSPADYAKQLIGRAIFLAVVTLGLRWVIRFNILGCFLMIAGISLLTGVAELLSQPNPFYRTNGYATGVLLVLLFSWPLMAWLRSGSNPGPEVPVS